MNTLKKKRVELGVTQDYLAEKIGVSKITINRWENDARIPNICDLENIIRYYQLTDEELHEFISYVNKNNR